MAERVGISLRTVRRRIADGTLPSLKVGGAVWIPASALAKPVASAVPRAAGHAAREAAGPYGIARESDEAYIRRWNREHRPDSWDRMLERRQSFERLEEARKQTRPPSGPHDTLDAILKQVRDELGQRALAVIAIDETNPHMFADAAMDAALLAGVRVPEAAYLEAARRTESTLITADRAQLAGALRLGLAALPLSEVPARDT